MPLLLYLIRKEEMDIFDIDVQSITSQYLEYIKKMKQLDLEVAGDFIAMAATLIQIKSQMLLPVHGEQDEDMEDPRQELVDRILEYQCFQQASKKLYDRNLLGRDIFKRGDGVQEVKKSRGVEMILDENPLFSLMVHYRNSVYKMKRAVHRVIGKTRSVAARILEIKDRLIVNKRVVLDDLVSRGEDFKSELLITFLSCLELSRMGFVSVYQSMIYGDIYLTAKKEIKGDIMARIEEYDGSRSDPE